MRSVHLSVLFLILAGCGSSTTYTYSHDTGNWYRSYCAQSDKEYRLFDEQYHCDLRKVTKGEAEGMHR